MNQCALIFILYLSTYATASRISNAQDSLDYNDEISNEIAEEIDYDKTRHIFSEKPIPDDIIDIEEGKPYGRLITKIIQKRELKKDNKQFLYNVGGNNHSGYNQNGNNLEWYSCSTGLVVQLRRIGHNSTNNSSGYDSIYNNFVKNLNNTNNPYNLKNNTIIKGFYGTYKVVRAYKPKNATNTNRNLKSNQTNDTWTYNLLNNNITYNHLSNVENKNKLVNNPNGIAKKKQITNSCSIMSSSDCPIGFRKNAGYCIPDPDCVESVDYEDYDFDFTDDQ